MNDYICFTGHRNKLCDLIDLEWINYILPDKIWIHGGAEGFDTQIAVFSATQFIESKIFKPDYKKYKDNPKYAPIARNHEMVEMSKIVVTNWDGRQVGGTYDTVKYAISKNLLVLRLPSTNIP